MDRFVTRSSSVKNLNNLKLTVGSTKSTTRKSNVDVAKSKTQPLQEKGANNLPKNKRSDPELLTLENNSNSNDSGVSSAVSLASVASNNGVQELNNKMLEKNYLGMYVCALTGNHYFLLHFRFKIRNKKKCK